MIKYNPQKIEKKWQKLWYDQNVFRAKDFSKDTKFYLLFEFPYPSGDGLHVGHCRPYIGLDIIARKRRMEGQNVLFPIGWDAFGLPTENYAIKKGIHPTLATKKNTDNFRKQMKSIGLSLDWSREINTTDPLYYRWTQWIFLQLFKHGLAYKSRMNINWCPKDKIGLANEEVVNGACERCGTAVERKEKEQWVIKITNYASRLVKDLDLVDYPERVKIQQKEWIGKSEGAQILFEVRNLKLKIPVFTTRADTLCGCTFLVLAPEHSLLEKIKGNIKNLPEVERYITESRQKSDLERLETTKEKSGIEIEGVKAINPLTKEEIPLFIADYVMLNYGTGAIMAVPAHDKRDFEFAKKYNLPITEVVVSTIIDKRTAPYEGEGVLINSLQFDGMDSKKASQEIIKFVGAKKTIQYKLRDWIFSRQHYWGEPIPMIECQKCGWVPVPEKDLPVQLPKVKKYEPTDTGESPLASIKKWVEVRCPECKGAAQRETDTMPNWAGSNWYYLRYTDPYNNKTLAAEKKLKYWMPVDWYNGGMEHTTLHLLYSRFIFKFLWDIKAVPQSLGSEPYKKRTSHGIILGQGGIKMSKSRGNVVNPDDVVKQYGADTLRMYEMFMGPFEQMIPWDEKGIIGVRRFLEKVYTLSHTKISLKKGDKHLNAILNKTIKKVSEDIEAMKFNTAVSSLMEFTNAWQISEVGLDKKNAEKFLKILSPFAPHLTEELWKVVGFKGSCSEQQWPSYNEKLMREEKVSLIIQINGKVRDKIEVMAGINQTEAEKIAFESSKIKLWTEGKNVIKIIFIPDKLINIVIG